MIMKNFINATLVKMMGNGASCNVTNVTGATVALNYYTGINDAFGNYADDIKETLSGRGVCFLYGGSEPTADDFTSDGTIVTGLTVTTVIKNNNSDAVISATAEYTITNGNDVDVTIDEICWVAGCFYGSSKLHYILADRTKLENPVTISAGGVGKVTYTIEASLLR